MVMFAMSIPNDVIGMLLLLKIIITSITDFMESSKVILHIFEDHYILSVANCITMLQRVFCMHAYVVLINPRVLKLAMNSVIIGMLCIHLYRITQLYFHQIP